MHIDINLPALKPTNTLYIGLRFFLNPKKKSRFLFKKEKESYGSKLDLVCLGEFQHYSKQNPNRKYIGIKVQKFSIIDLDFFNQNLKTFK